VVLGRLVQLMRTRGEIEAWLTEQEARLEARRNAPRCRRCQGVGFTRWEAFVCGLAGLLSGLSGELPVPAPCPRCGGTGRQP
jgi:hypothetical protein